MRPVVSLIASRRPGLLKQAVVVQLINISVSQKRCMLSLSAGLLKSW